MKEENFMLFKPYGYLSQFITHQTKRKNKRLLGELFDFPPGTMSIGRLDEDSEGLLLLTTNGKISAAVTGGKVEKEYFTQVSGTVGAEAIRNLQEGVEIGIHGKKYQTLPCKVKLLNSPPVFPARGKKIRDERHGPTSWISITLTEGKFRQVRKMTAAVGFPTLRLVRVRIGNMHLNQMQPGEVILIERFNLNSTQL